MSDQTRGIIPPRSMGDCRWCGAQMTRLQYLMCSDCNRIAERVPSKVQVILRSADFAKTTEGKATVEKVVPELTRFILDSQQDFPANPRDQEHWAKMLDECETMVSRSDLLERAKEMKSAGETDLPSEQELRRFLGAERLLRYMIHVAVQQGALKLEGGGDNAKFCVVCGGSTSDEIRMLCYRCMDELVIEPPAEESVEEEESSGLKGMATRDIVLGDRRK